MKKHVLMAVLPLLAWGCGDATDADNDGVADGIRDPNNVSVVVPSTPKGTVSGQVLSTTLQPIADVTVAMTIGSQPTGKSATTDASGNFVMTDVPAGAQVLLTFSKGGYSTLRATSTVPSAAGTVPINNGNASFGPVTLTQLNSSLAVTVVTPQGRPAVGAKGVLEVDKAGSVILSNYDSVSSVISKVYVEATADANGVLTFTGIPSGVELARLGGQFTVWIAPMDTNGDGISDTGGYTKVYSNSEIVGTQSTTLAQLKDSKPSGAGALNIEGGNVSSLKGAAEVDPLRNMVRPGEPIFVYFNQPVQPGSVFVRLTDEYAKESLPVTASVNVGGYSATITPGNGIVQEGKEYNIFVRAVAAEGGSNYSRTGFFFGGDQSAPRAVTISEIRYQELDRPPAATATQLNSLEEVFVNFSAPIAKQVGQSVQVFFASDIDNNGTVGGNSFGEVGNYSGQGFPLEIAEPTKPVQTRTPAELPVFGIQASGYSTRYFFRYTGAVALNPSQVRLVVSFSNLAPVLGTNDVYESIWGQPINTDLEATGIGQHPAPTPAP
ncbi:carboxypeptidase regulatory-like domain-containing protein [Corallococcus sp. CA054B]|uniref:carboxypeptidase-like regulatory domain-containing protein n=1 Tax=Corallococcus sp. CA054B TaxID=2316734 RepID=UPI000EA40746|nr:carboxypeptidase-like regulatory domain-containing protein [Corallococcus sp. CA054B]RKG66038.1 carboxypeptidase regulatory-like domain-containing protein [Corallococcus sp. CA054B]